MNQRGSVAARPSVNSMAGRASSQGNTNDHSSVVPEKARKTVQDVLAKNPDELWAELLASNDTSAAGDVPTSFLQPTTSSSMVRSPSSKSTQSQSTSPAKPVPRNLNNSSGLAKSSSRTSSNRHSSYIPSHSTDALLGSATSGGHESPPHKPRKKNRPPEASSTDSLNAHRRSKAKSTTKRPVEPPGSASPNPYEGPRTRTVQDALSEDSEAVWQALLKPTTSKKPDTDSLGSGMMLLSDLPRASSSPYDALPLGGKASSRLIEEGSRKSAVRQLSAAKKTHHSTTMITASASSSASSVDSTQSVSTQMRSLPPTHIESQVFEVKASPLGAGSPPQQNTRGQHEIASPSSNKPRPEAATSPISSDRPAAAPNIDAAQSTVGAAGGANMTSAVNSDTASTGAAGLSGIRALLKRFSRGMGIGKPANNKPTDSKPKDGRSNSPRASDTNSKAAKAVTGAKGKPS